MRGERLRDLSRRWRRAGIEDADCRRVRAGVRLRFLMSKTTPGWCFSIDVGGTFTDCVARTPAGELRTLKVLSSAALKGNVDAAEGRGIRDPGLRRARDDIFRGFQLRLLDADGVERERAEVAGSLGADGSISTAEELSLIHI